MLRRWLMGVAAVTLAGCACSSDPVTETAYAAMARYPTEFTTCVVHQDCAPLCRTVFQIGDTEIQRCELVALDGYPSGQPPRRPLTLDELQQIRGGTLQVTYVPRACDDGGSAWDVGYDGSTDDGSTDDGSTDDGSTDDGSTDDGSTDDGSTDDGSTDDGSTDDGSTDDGSTDDGSTDDGSTDDGSTDDGSTDDGSTDDAWRGSPAPHRQGRGTRP